MRNGTVDIPPNERGVVRVFSLSMTDDEAQKLRDTPEDIAKAFGIDSPLDLAHIVFVPVKDLSEIGLSGYLSEGAGISEAQLAPDRTKLDQLSGWVIVVYSLAFGDAEATLRPAPSLTLIGTYGETRTDWTDDNGLTSQSALPSAHTPAPKKKPSDAAMSGRIAMLVLIGLGLFTYVFVRIAG